MQADANELAKFFAEKICSKHNQHVMCRFVGKAGMGKSWGGLSLARGVAEEVARIKGGSPDDYFSYEKDLAIMSTEEIQRVLSNPGKYHILMLDDVGVGVGARDFQKNSNKDLAKIIQTFRPQNNLVIETLQAGFLVDKIFRLLAHYEIEIESTNFDYGYIVAKCQEIDYKHKKDKIYFPYIYYNGKTYVRHIFQAPPAEVTEKYEIERAKQLKRIMEKQAQEEKEKEEQKPQKIKETAIKLHEDWKNGLFEGLGFREVCEAHNINYQSARAIISRNHSSQHNTDM